MPARYYIAMDLCLSVSVCQTSRYCVETVERIKMVLGREASFIPSYMVFKDIEVSLQMTCFFWNFVANSYIINFRHGTSIVATMLVV